MPQLPSFWTSLDPRRRIVVALAAVAVFVAVLGLSRMATTPGMALLYAGLDMTQAGEVVQVLEQTGARYEVRGDAIFVEEPRRDELRMTLAADGLPASNGTGYELLDGLSGFGTTSQMFDAAYWRAKEGELARTIVASPMVRSARVHISNPSTTPFRRESQPTASVTVTAVSGSVAEAQAQAMRFLVASAVAGLEADGVAVIDGSTGRVIGGEDETPEAQSGGLSARLKANVERLLEARVGPGNAIVEVSVETVTDREAITERRFDPEERVAISTDVEEVTASSTNEGGAGVTVASNLPAGDAAADGNTSQSQNSEVRERTNFEVSETTREILKVPGAIRRLTVAVLVNGVPGEAADGTSQLLPRPEEEMAALRDLVAATVGFDEARGDVITLRSLQFEGAIAEGSGPVAGFADRFGLDMMRLIQVGTLALVALALGLFVVRPVLVGRREETAGLALPGADRETAFDIDGTAATISAEEAPTAGSASPEDGLPAMAAIGGLERDQSHGVAAIDPDDPVSNLKQLIEERQPDTIEILKSWLEDDSRSEVA